MKLSEALKILQEPAQPEAEKFTVFLACGCTPIHLETFLTAHMRGLFPDHSIQIKTGIYGDLLGNLDRMANAAVYAGAVVIEWADLDMRLGLRGLGGWTPAVLPDILETVKVQADRMFHSIKSAAQSTPIAISLPTLPMPPVSHYESRQAGPFELDLRASLNRFALKAVSVSNIKIINSERLDALSPAAERLSVKSELSSGFPYKTPHASIIAELLAGLIRSRPPKKGLITDLDDTFWDGILGEVGIDRISWDLDHHSHMHALYQQMLHSLSESGVLIGVASKNDHDLVVRALEQRELLIPTERFFPIEVHWEPKSQSVGRILKAWNIGAGDVVFVDDSPMELDQVKFNYPEMECMLFPKEDDQAVYALLEKLRDLFGKETIFEEDVIRLETLRRPDAPGNDLSTQNGSMDMFLEQAGASLTIYSTKDPEDHRAFELVNKTNQFNLNGLRYNLSGWQKALQNENSFLIVVAYKDKYGPLGKIAVLLGQHNHGRLFVETWVMSCRAFARRIEHRCLEYLFNAFAVEEIEMAFRATERNGPMKDFLAAFSDGEKPQSSFGISKQTFMKNCPKLFHSVNEL